MSDSFWAMVGVVLPVIVVQIFQYLATQRNAKKSEADRAEIKAQVCEVAAHIDTIRTDKASVQLMIAGAERKNISEGIAIGKRQSDFSPLTDTIDITRGSR